MLARLSSVVFLAGALFCTAAQAAVLTVSGSGQFGLTANGSPEYQPNAIFSFSFGVVSPLVQNPTDALIDPIYTLSGQPGATPVSVSFADDAGGGLFSLGFDDGGTLSFSGPDIGSSGVVLTGTFTGAAFGSADDFGTATIVVAATAVPLPPSLATLGSGLLALAASRRIRLASSRPE